MKVKTKEDKTIRIIKGIGIGLLTLSALTIPAVKIISRRNRLKITMNPKNKNICSNESTIEDAQVISYCELLESNLQSNINKYEKN